VNPNLGKYNGARELGKDEALDYTRLTELRYVGSGSKSACCAWGAIWIAIREREKKGREVVRLDHVY
jgi:hypothetical protein